MKQNETLTLQSYLHLFFEKIIVNYYLNLTSPSKTLYS